MFLKIDLKVAIIQTGAFLLRPVCIGLPPTSLEQLGQHHENRRVLFPDHSPKVAHRVEGGCLAGDVIIVPKRLSTALGLDDARVDIVGIRLPIEFCQADSRRVERQHIAIPVLRDV